MEEEKKIPDENKTEAASEEQPKERRGLFGGKKRERNDKAVLGLYTVAAVYLFYTAFVTAEEIYKGKVPAGRDTILSVIFVIVFGGVAIWLLYTCWHLKKAIKAKEELEMAEAAERDPETGKAEEAPAKKGGLLKSMFTVQRPDEPSVASRAMVYQNPADDDEEEEASADGEKEEEASADGEAKEEEASYEKGGEGEADPEESGKA